MPIVYDEVFKLTHYLKNLLKYPVKNKVGIFVWL